MDNFYRAWARADFDKAYAAAKQEGGSWKGDSIRAVLGSLVPRDIEKFLRLAAAVEKPSHVEAESVALAMRTLAGGGMEQALAAFAKLTAPHLREPAAQALAALQTTADPDASIAWAKSLPSARERHAAITGTVRALLKTDPDRAATLLPLLPAGQQGTGRQYCAVASALVKRDGASGLAWAMENLPKDQLDDVTFLIRESGVLPAVERLQFLRNYRARVAAESQDSLRGFDRALTWHSSPRAGIDHVAELRALAAESSDTARNVMLGEIADGLRLKDQPGLLTLLPTLPPDAQSAIAARCLLFSRENPSALLPLLTALTDIGTANDTVRVMFTGGVREAVHSFGESLAALPEAERAAALACVPAQHRADVVHGMAATLASTDTESTQAWAATLTPADQAAAAGGIAQHMAWDNEMAASEWINSLDRGPARDAATQSLCAQIQTKEPDSAWQWALSIGDPAQRVSTLGGVYAQWAKKGRADAAAALSAAPLNPVERQSIQQFKP